ncbi:MAG: NUDIX domain-containing protein [Candidatus Woesearchaeota archaeon]
MKVLLIVKGLVQYENSVLIVQRSAHEKFGANRWTTPGGHVEKHESLEDAIVREIKEEVGLDVQVLRIIHTSFFQAEDADTQVLSVEFLCESDSKDVSLNEELQDYRWITEIPKDIFLHSRIKHIIREVL